ncbi:MAG: hypothetical protein H0W72_06135 [Planctomycetes bacterium]|nr:hypothetical protein [Planctomycetota bacterium]
MDDGGRMLMDAGSPARRSGRAAPTLGFTLTEVALSMLLITIGVLSVMVILPSGIRSQILARDRIVSAALAVYAIDMAYNETLPKWMRTPSPVFRDVADFRLQRVPDTSAAAGPQPSGSRPASSRQSDNTGENNPPHPYPLDAATEPSARGNIPLVRTGIDNPKNNFSIKNYTILAQDPVVHAPDLEVQISNWHHGIMPLPPEISARLESDNDEISKVLADGGQLYFFGKPAALYGDAKPVPSLIQRLVFAVVGHPQRNAPLYYMDSYFPGYRPFTGTDGAFDDPTAPGVLPTGGVSSSDPAIYPEIYLGNPNPLQPFAPYGPTASGLNGFSPEERCRQLVFWAVDWYQYEDTELLQAPPFDAWRFPAFDHRTHQNAEGHSDWRLQRAEMPDLHDHLMLPASIYCHYGNDGYTNGGWMVNDYVSGAQIATTVGADIWRPQVYHWRIPLAVHGVDYNGNRRLDRGPTPPATRMRAVTLARYNFYDPRAWLTLNLNLPPDAL